MTQPRLQRGDAILVVDVQNDFCPGGALPVERGDAIVEPLNHWLAEGREHNIPVFASRDWHPEEHVSFAERGGPWPPHCIRNTPGAEFHPDLHLPPGTVIISKAVEKDRDAYSAFDGTGLADRLREAGFKRLFIGGLAQDICVRATALDALKEGFEVHLIAEATRPVDPEAGRKTNEELQAAGAVLEQAQEARA